MSGHKAADDVSGTGFGARFGALQRVAADAFTRPCSPLGRALEPVEGVVAARRLCVATRRQRRRSLPPFGGVQEAKNTEQCGLAERMK